MKGTTMNLITLQKGRAVITVQTIVEANGNTKSIVQKAIVGAKSEY